MSEPRAWWLDKKVKKTLKALTENGFQTFLVATKGEALEKVLSLIPLNANVGIGGSITIREINLIEALRAKEHVIFEHWSQPEENQVEVMRKQLTSDVFVASCNAVTEDGKLINVDNVGNRVASIIFGPKKVILIVGVNKIVKDLDEGLKRIKNIAAPANAKRRRAKTPCTVTGECADCNSPQRICRVTTIIERKPPLTDITVILVGESLGY